MPKFLKLNIISYNFLESFFYLIQLFHLQNSFKYILNKYHYYLFKIYPVFNYRRIFKEKTTKETLLI